jgi:hypothetical protein
MARYLISYLDGESETVTADHVAIDYEARAYVFRNGTDQHAEPEAIIPTALIPAANVRSIHRRVDEVTD